jgi:hypothetical protein
LISFGPPLSAIQAEHFWNFDDFFGTEHPIDVFSCLLYKLLFDPQTLGDGYLLPSKNPKLINTPTNARWPWQHSQILFTAIMCLCIEIFTLHFFSPFCLSTA